MGRLCARCVSRATASTAAPDRDIRRGFAFGVAAYHVGLNDNFSWALDAPGLSNHGNGIHSLKVPDGGAVTLNVRLSAIPEGPAGDVVFEDNFDEDVNGWDVDSDETARA